MKPFTPAFHRAVHFGLLTGVHLPDSKEPVPESILSILSPSAQDYARTLGGYRQVDWVGGRLALLGSLNGLGPDPGDLLPDEHGAPRMPPETNGSVSHKRTLAVALAARQAHGAIGVDLEDLSPTRDGIAERVLVPDELATVQALPAEYRWVGTVLRFSFKEALYKALHPHVKRFVGFEEARVDPDTDQTAHIELMLKNGEGPFVVEARYLWMPGRVLTMVRLHPS